MHRWVVVGLGLCSSTSVLAALLPVAPATLAHHSDAVVVVDVVAARAEERLTAPGRAGDRGPGLGLAAEIVTVVDVAVVDVVAGAPLALQTVTVQGGQVGHRRVVVWEEAVLPLGERLVVFVAENDTPGDAFVVGGALGVFAFSSSAAAQALVDDTVAVRRPVVAASSTTGDAAAGAGRVQPAYVADGERWGRDPVAAPFFFAPATFAAVGDVDEALAALVDGMVVWNDEGGAAVRLRDGGVLAAGAPEPDILVYRGEGLFDGTTASSALAVTTTTYEGDEIVACDIKMYATNVYGRIDWSLSADAAPPDTFDLRQNVTHEVGHCLGLGHSEVDGAIMAATLDDGTTASDRHLHPDDQAGLQALYGVAPAPGEGEGEGEEGEGEEGEGEEGEGEGEGEEGEGEREDSGAGPGCAGGGAGGGLGLLVLLVRGRRRRGRG
jgi:hypothetical protein